LESVSKRHETVGGKNFKGVYACEFCPEFSPANLDEIRFQTFAMTVPLAGKMNQDVAFLTNFLGI
jgi:hypothetical protein